MDQQLGISSQQCSFLFTLISEGILRGKAIPSFGTPTIFAWPHFALHFFFPQTKSFMKEPVFDDVEYVKRCTTEHLNLIPEEDFQDGFEVWKKRMEKCVRGSRNSFEGDKHWILHFFNNKISFLSDRVYVSGNPCMYTPSFGVLVKINLNISLDKISTDTELLCKMWLTLTAIWQQGVGIHTYWLYHVIHWWTLRCKCYLKKCQAVHNLKKKVLHTVLCDHLTFTTFFSQDWQLGPIVNQGMSQ